MEFGVLLAVARIVDRKYRYDYSPRSTGKLITKVCLYTNDGHGLGESNSYAIYVMRLQRSGYFIRRRSFSTNRAMAYARKITSYGNRYVTNYYPHRRARDYIYSELRRFGYRVYRQYFRTERGALATNIIARHPRNYSYQPDWLTIGAHYNSENSVGGLDNASGCGVLLELARDFAGADMPYMVDFIFIDSEEAVTPAGTRHPGGKVYLNKLQNYHFRNLSGYINLDTVGHWHSPLRIGDMSSGNSWISSYLRYNARRLDIGVTRGTGSYFRGMADYESFARRRIPIASVATDNP